MVLEHAKVYARGMQKFRGFFASRKFSPAKVLTPKVVPVDKVKYLGIYINKKNLSWSFLIQQFSKKIAGLMEFYPNFVIMPQ